MISHGMRWVTVCAVGCVFALSGCGSSQSARPPAGQAKSPAQLIADAAAALRGAGAYMMQGELTENHHRALLKVVTSSAHSLKLQYSIGGESVQMISLPTGAYLRANKSFWIAAHAPSAAGLADRWIQIPRSDTHNIVASLGPFAPATLARCLGEDHGTLSLAGKATVQGHPATLIKDAGNAPGSTPSEIAVAADGPPYPLRLTATGNQRAGGRIDVCNNGQPTDTRGVITLTDFGHVPAITQPQHATQMGQSPST